MSGAAAAGSSSTYASYIIQRWRTVFLSALVGLGLGTAYAFTTPQWFEARLTVVPAERGQDMNILSKLPGIGNLGGAAPTDVQRIRAVLGSRSVADEVIKKFQLQARYAEDTIEATREDLANHCGTSVDKKSGIVELVCEDKDPKTAQALASYFGEIGNEVFKRISASSAREERRFLEAQVAQAKKDVEQASADLRDFQQKHRLVDLPEQSKAVISAMATMKGELVSKQLELSYLTSFSSASESNVRQLQQQIAALESKLKQLENGSQDSRPQLADPKTGSATAGDSSFFPEAMRVPDLRFELEQLVREQKIKETLFFLMSQRYETAKADEARDTSTFQILDYPTVPTHKSRPKRLRLMIAGLAWGAVLACFVLAGLAWRTTRGQRGQQ